MQQVSSRHANNALQMLADAAINREQDLQEYSGARILSDSDEDNDSNSPIFDALYSNGGGPTIVEMTNFDVSEFNSIWNTFSDHITTHWNVGRGRKSTFKAKDVLCMTATVLKHGGQWDFLGRMFRIKGPTFERLISGFLDTIYVKVFSHLVHNANQAYPMTRLIRKKTVFKHFPFARYATDVTFQECNLPTGNLQEGKKYFSGKHKLYGYKLEVSVLPNGLAIGCSTHYPGSVADIDIFYKRKSFHNSALQKQDDELEVADFGPLEEEHPKKWATLTDKGYQGSVEFCHAIYPKKKTEEWAFINGSMSNKYRWSEETYDIIAAVCVSFTNAHIRNHPLRASDGEMYQRMKNRKYQIGNDRIEKRRRVRRTYREKRKQRVAMSFGASFEDDDSNMI